MRLKQLSRHQFKNYLNNYPKQIEDFTVDYFKKHPDEKEINLSICLNNGIMFNKNVLGGCDLLLNPDCIFILVAGDMCRMILNNNSFIDVDPNEFLKKGDKNT